MGENMYFCENCHLPTETERCPHCKRKNLRPIAPQDMCELTECPQQWYELEKHRFQALSIPVVTLPVGSGVNSMFALPLENYRLYVPWERFDDAVEVLEQIQRERLERLRGTFSPEDIDRLTVPARVAKRARRKLKLAKDADVAEICRQVVRSVEEIFTGDTLVSGHKQYCCYADGVYVWLDAVTMEVISVNK